jgi:hypothetical protein
LSTARLIVVMTFLSIFAVAIGVPMDSDMWWHLRAGAWMTAHHHILTADVFSWTRLGRPWVDHSWLSEIGLFLLWRGFGYAGISVAVAAMATATYLFVFFQTEGSVYLRSFVVEFAALSTGLPWWPARPEVASLVLTACFAYLLALFRWHRVNRLWLLPPLMLLWVNVHAGFILGFALLGLTIAGQLLSRVWRQQGPGIADTQGLRRLGAVSVACLAMVPLNPHGVSMLWYPFQVMSLRVLRGANQEWMPPNLHSPLGLMYLALLLGAFAAMALRRRRIDPTDLLLIGSFAFAGLVAARNTVLFTLVAPPILTRYLVAQSTATATDTSGAVAARPGAAILWLLLIVVLATAALNVTVQLRPTVMTGAWRRSLPVAAVDYIRRTHPPGPMFNTWAWGGYLMWALYPEYAVYVDGRTDLYGDAFLTEYLGVIAGSDDWRRLFREQHIRLVVVDTNAPLANALRHAPEWTQSYHDTLASVFVHNNQGEKPLSGQP